MSNYNFKEKNLCLRIKNLLSLMLSLPDNRDYSTNDLCSICNKSIIIIRNALKELKESHYLEMNENRNKKRKYIYDCIFYEKPRINP